ncbi:hypothetical protein RSOLAG22IIIB_10096 [Rhizoctonia solani]|uniref:DUF6532 domain-containing protein n=1 Tax=Rhizoctonia solani TaxID=456999 RepID=A0A0K6G0R3_9AGAM|nr:hypothetical protein RSOLAG22IIIB_10096 [Rhizoctonia solani]
MPTKRAASKRELEEPGDISVARAPAAPKKSKGASVAVAKKTRSATKQANSDDNDGQTQVQTISKPDEDPVRLQSTPATTKAARSKKLATSTQQAPPPPDNLTPTEPPLSATEGKKSTRTKQLSAIAEKANKQAVARQNTKESQAAKKAKKAEAAVYEETPDDTAVFLAKAKGQSQPSKTSPNLVSPKRSRPPVDREKAMEQLLNARALSPNPGATPLADTMTDNTTRVKNVATKSSAPQGLNSKPRPRIVTQPGLQVPRSTPPSWDVSPVAPPLLQVPSSNSVSRDVSPSAESAATVDDDYDEDVDIRVDYKGLLDGIPKPWNLGPVSVAPSLPEPLHTARLKPEVLQQATNSGKEKPKAPRALVNNFRVQDQAHLKLAIDYMDTLVATICAFPDDDTRWTFATLSNYWASKKLGRNYRLDRQSDYCRLLYSRISQSRGKLVTAIFSSGIQGKYKGLSWKEGAGSDDAQEAAIRTRVASMIKDGSFTAPRDRPSAYYQHSWFEHILKLGYWQNSTSKGMSEAHAEYFGGGISYPLMALAVTVTEKMLADVAAKPNPENTGHAHKNTTANAFSHTLYATRFNAHLFTLARLHRTHGPILTDYLTRLHKRLRAPFLASVPSSHTLQLAIPLSALNNYGVEQRPAPIKEKPNASEAAPSTRRPKVRTRSAPSINLGAILNSPTLNSDEKVKLLSIICESAGDDGSQTGSTRTVQQYEGLLAGVNADSDDSEVEARRAGALPDTSKTGVGVRMGESDEEVMKDEAEGEGESEAEAEVEGDGEGSEGEDKDESEAEVVDEEDPEAEESGGAVSTNENEGDANEENDDDRRFFDADGGLPSPAGSESDGEADSDGEGASGAVATQVDGDQTMMTAVASDSEDD